MYFSQKKEERKQQSSGVTENKHEFSYLLVHNARDIKILSFSFHCYSRTTKYREPKKDIEARNG